MAELVDAHGSGPCAARCGGSSPSVGTIILWLFPFSGNCYSDFQNTISSRFYPLADAAFRKASRRERNFLNVSIILGHSKIPDSLSALLPEAVCKWIKSSSAINSFDIAKCRILRNISTNGIPIHNVTIKLMVFFRLTRVYLWTPLDLQGTNQHSS